MRCQEVRPGRSNGVFYVRENRRVWRQVKSRMMRERLSRLQGLAKWSKAGATCPDRPYFRNHIVLHDVVNIVKVDRFRTIAGDNLNSISDLQWIALVHVNEQMLLGDSRRGGRHIFETRQSKLTTDYLPTCIKNNPVPLSADYRSQYRQRYRKTRYQLRMESIHHHV